MGGQIVLTGLVFIMAAALLAMISGADGDLPDWYVVSVVFLFFGGLALTLVGALAAIWA